MVYLTTVKTTKDRCLKQLPVQAKTNSLLIVAVLQPSTCVFLCTSIFVPHLWLSVRFFPGIPSNKLENIIQTIWLQIHPKIWKALKNWSQNCKVIPKPVGGIFVSPAFKKTTPPYHHSTGTQFVELLAQTALRLRVVGTGAPPGSVTWWRITLESGPGKTTIAQHMADS